MDTNNTDCTDTPKQSSSNLCMNPILILIPIRFSKL